MTAARKEVPAKSISIPIAPDGIVRDDVATSSRIVPFMATRTPGIVITPAQSPYGGVSFKNGCNLTHTASGFRIAGTFQDVRVAHLVAGALGGIMQWDGRALTDHRAVVVSVRSALLPCCPKLLEWMGVLNDWEVGEAVDRKKGNR
jgi:hypothetical protein